jgi:hypothetical protein
MTTAYNPAAQFLTEALRDSAITQLADALDTLRIATDKRNAAHYLTDGDFGVYEATQSVLAVAEIVVRRHQLTQSV